jgi:Low-density lipoprotein receptor repeat class B
MKTATQPQTSKPTRPSSAKSIGRLYFLEASGGRIHSANADGSDRKVILSGARVPDGVVVDVEAGHIYWTNMGVPSKNDGSIERADLDGKNRVTIIGEGKTFTPKQLHLEKKSGKLYWCDREGMRVMRANLDGSNIETLVDTSNGGARPGTDQRNGTQLCVGITVDPDRGQFYWTQKGPANAGKGRIFRAKIDIPRGETAANRTDIETLFDGLPEPIDLELDLKNRFLYWTDRGDAPRGNTVNRAPLDGDFNKRQAPEILLTHLEEGIGIALDFKGNRMFTTDLAGNIFCAKLDGLDKKPVLVAQGNLTGIAYAEINTKGN